LKQSIRKFLNIEAAHIVLFETLFSCQCPFDPNPYCFFVKMKKVLDGLKGQSHEKVGEMRVEGDSLGPN
jgi:hypothetical protein